MKKVLVIEDNEHFLQNTIEILKLADYEIRGARRGREGIQKAYEFIPDLILCDIELPDLEGQGILQVLRRSVKLRNVIFIFMSGIPEHQNFRKAMNLGADDFIFKPFTGTELLDIVNTRFKRLEDCLDFEIQDDLRKLSKRNDGKLLDPLFSGQPSHLMRKGDQLYRSGQQINYVPFLTDGFVRTSQSDRSGKELTTTIYRKGQLVGVADVICGSSWSEDAYAIGNVTVIFIPLADWAMAIHQELLLCQLVQQQLAESLRIKHEQLFVHSYLHLRGRVASAILNLSDSLKMKEEENQSFKVTRYILATLSGVAKESVTRTVIDFIAEGLIEETNKGFRILNKAKLELLAGR